MNPRIDHARALSAPDLAFRDEVLEGLRADRKALSPKFFYDERGAWLFERICELPEYYLTRSELEILRAHVQEIADLAGPRCALIEYGSGAGLKVRLLLDALREPVSYTPVDISGRQLTRVAASLARDYPNVVIQPTRADYTRPFELPRLPAHDRRVAFFPGSTIGNFHPIQAISFLRQVRRTVSSSGALVLGVDRRKDIDALEAAYNDAEGVTAEFNLNVLSRLNRELGADFDLGLFRHRAFFNEEAGRIEMHIEVLRAHDVTVAGETVHLARGETIWTESSYKYDEGGLEGLASAAGFRIEHLVTDVQERFWVAYLVPSPGRGAAT